MAVGSATWARSRRASASVSLTVAAAGLVLMALILARFRLLILEGHDFFPTKFAPAPRFDLCTIAGPSW